MSAPQQNMGPRGAGTPNNAGAPMTPGATSNTASQGGNSNQNLNQIVIDYLNKKGYTKTENTLRREMNHVDAHGKVLHARAEDYGGQKYFHAYVLFTQYIDDNLEIYKQELQRLRWPIFVYSFLSLVDDNYPDLSQKFFQDYKQPFEREHEHELGELQNVRHSEHLDENETARVYFKNRYRLTLVESTHFSLISFLESKERAGGSVLLGIMQSHMTFMSVNRASTADRSFATMLARQGAAPAQPEEDEGIPGHNPGSANTDQNAPAVLTRLNLGPLGPAQGDEERRQDVRDELEDIDKIDPPAPGENTLVDEYDLKIKREETEDRSEAVPYPRALARDVISDVEKVRAYRDRFKFGPPTGGIGPGLSVCMYTFHNTFDSITCFDISGDLEMVAAGFEESYIRLWSLDGSPLKSAYEEEQPAASRRLIAHSAQVYAVSFSPGMYRADDADKDNPESPSLRPQYLVSCSADTTIRLWELTTYHCLVVYKGHTTPVWDVRFSPHGTYFLSGGRDKTARLWNTSTIAPLRILAGHDGDVDVVAWHPNGAYVFTGSSDLSVRMWDLSSGRAVRLFTTHTSPLTGLACSPSGKLLASADDSGLICVWNIESGRRVKMLRGHGRGGIFALDWGAESSVLVSAGLDGTVRSWDVALSAGDAGAPAPAAQAGDAGAASAGSSKADGKGGAGAAGAEGAKAGGAGGAAKIGGGRGGLMSGGSASGVSAEQISCFATKKSPVYLLRMTEMNLCLAAGCYMP